MDTPGNILKSARENQKKSLKDIEKVLKINTEYLRAIENDNYHRLPADLFAKSYLRSYSRVLGLDADHILNLYNDQFLPKIKLPEPEEKLLHKILPLFQFNYKYLLAICICIGLITVFVATYTKHDTKDAFVTIDKAPPDVEPEKNGTEKATVEEAVMEKSLSLKIVALELTWVSIKIDSADPEEMLLRAGESTTVTAHEKFVLKIGNAGSTSLILNGRDIGNLGPHGQLVDITLP